MSKDIVEKLNDPQYVRELAVRHGLIKDDAKPTRVAQRTRPQLKDITKIEDVEERFAALQENYNALLDYVDSSIDGEFSAREKAVKDREAQQRKAEESAKIRAFALKVPDYVKYYDAIAKYYQAYGDIEKAYKQAREDAGNPVTAEEEAKWKESPAKKDDKAGEKGSVKPKPRLPDRSSSDEDLDDPNKRKKVSDKSTKDRTLDIIDNVLAEHNLESLEIEGEN